MPVRSCPPGIRTPQLPLKWEWTLPERSPQGNARRKDRRRPQHANPPHQRSNTPRTQAKLRPKLQAPPQPTQQRGGETDLYKRSALQSPLYHAEVRSVNLQRDPRATTSAARLNRHPVTYGQTETQSWSHELKVQRGYGAAEDAIGLTLLFTT